MTPLFAIPMAGVMGLRDVAAHHMANQFLARHFRSLGGDNQFAVAQHRDAIGNLQRFLERMRYVDDSDAAGAQVTHQVEEMHDLLGREAGGRFVKNDDAGIVVDGARDLDHLPLGSAEHRHRNCRVDLEVEGLQ